MSEKENIAAPTSAEDVVVDTESSRPVGGQAGQRTGRRRSMVVGVAAMTESIKEKQVSGGK